MTTTQTAPNVAIAGYYGEAPVVLGHYPYLAAQWREFMHYLYLPVRIPTSDPGLNLDADPTGQRYADVDAAFALPQRLQFLHEPVMDAIADARRAAPHLSNPYVYVTARRGHAAPGNPLNRPGPHCDDFGGTDLNYIWSDRYPTRFLTSNEPLDIPADDAESMVEMARLFDIAENSLIDWHRRSQFNGNAERPRMSLSYAPTGGRMMRLSPYVIHDTPRIPEPGGMRSFFKISVSTHRYDLVGNSHNYDLDYDWPMVERAAIRNQPASTTTTGAILSANRDYSTPNLARQETSA